VEKSFIVARPDGTDLRVERVPLNTREFVYRTINTSEQLDAAVTELSQRPESRVKAVLVLDYLTSVPEVEQRLAAAIGDRLIMWARPMTIRSDVLANPVLLSNTEEENATPTLEACLGRVAAGVEKEFTLDLIKRGKDALPDWRKRIGL